MRAHLDLIRVRDLLDILAVYALGALLSSPPAVLGTSFAFGGIALSCSLFFTHIVNDLADVAIDTANNRKRPLVIGVISCSAARDLAILYAIAALASAVAGGMFLLTATAFLLLLGASYSLPPLRASRHGILGTAVIITGYVFAPFILGAYLTHGAIVFNTAGFFFLGTITVSCIGRLFLKDFRDVRGDTVYKKRTPLGIFGAPTTTLVTATLAGIGWLLFIGFTATAPLRTSARIIVLSVSTIAHALLAVSAWQLRHGSLNRGAQISTMLTYYSFRALLVVTLWSLFF